MLLRKLFRRGWKARGKLRAPLRKQVCGCCGSDRIEWKLHANPNTGAITWQADDPFDVWCDACDDWGGGSIPAHVYRRHPEKRYRCDACLQAGKNDHVGRF